MKTIFCVLVIFFAATQSVSYSGISFNEKEQQESLKYWTPERMASAIPMENILTNKTLEKLVYEGKIVVKPDTDFVKPESLYQEQPYKTVGRAFFRYGQGSASCSGSASGNNVILTAAHCVFKDGRFHSSWIFVPQYNNNRAPVGRWATRGNLIFPEYRQNSNSRGRDVAFVIAAKRNEKTLEEVIGKLSIGTCDVGDSYLALGYPSPGSKMKRTIGKILRRYPVPRWYNPSPVGIRSAQGPGSSGGPWITKKKNKKTGKVEHIACSVVSFGIRYTYYVFGPYFDKEVLSMHKLALERN
eukprot:gene7156-11469_t